MKIAYLAMMAAATLASSAGAVTINTGVAAIGATHVLITHSAPGSNDGYIQIGEVQAFTPAALNVAQASNGGVATGTAAFGSVIGNANDGSTNRNFFDPPSIVHTGNSPGDFIRIDFSSPARLVSVILHGRSDCCLIRNSWTLSLFAGSDTLWSGLVDGTDGQISTINFTAPATGGAVPEPASWALLIAGFGLTGAVARRRRGLVQAAH